MHVSSNEPAALLLKPGPFTAEFTGFISIELRAQHTFTAEVAGAIELQINGKEVLNSTAIEPLETDSETRNYSFTSKPIRLNKGTNALVLRYTSPTNGPAILRLFWSSETAPSPFPFPRPRSATIPIQSSHDPSQFTTARSCSNNTNAPVATPRPNKMLPHGMRPPSTASVPAFALNGSQRKS